MAMGTWETVGQISGTWLGAVIWAASAPVVAIDGPLPIMDAAWVYANARNTNSLRKRGGRIGEGLDNYLAEPVEPSGGSWGNGYIAPETSNKNKPTTLDTSGYGPGFKMDFDLFTGTGLDFSNIKFAMNFATQIKEVAQELPGIAMGLQYTYRDSRWPAWDD